MQQVRQTAVSFHGSIILCSCEDSTVYRWDAASFENDEDGPAPSEDDKEAGEEDDDAEEKDE